MMLEIVPNMKMRSAINQYSILGLHGPGTARLLSELSAEAIGETFPEATACEAEIADIRCVVARPGIAGRPVWELHVPPDRVPLLFQSLVDSGAALAGTGALAEISAAAGRLSSDELRRAGTPDMAGLSGLCDPEKVYIGSGREMPD